MFVRTFIIAWATIAMLASCSNSEPTIDYLVLNYNKTDHNIERMIPDRLRNLKGHIRSITQYAYPPKAKAGSSRQRELTTDTPSYTLVFTREGFIAEEWECRREDVVAHKTWYRSYRAHQIDSVIHWTDAGKITSREVYTYDKDGILVGGYNQSDGQRKEKVLNIVKSGDTLVVVESTAKHSYLQGRRVKMETEGQNGSRVCRYYYFPSGALRQAIAVERGTVDEDERFDGMGNLVYWLAVEREDVRPGYGTEETSTYRNGQCIQKIRKHVDHHRYKSTDTLTYEYRGGLLVRLFNNGRPDGHFEYNEHNDIVREWNDFFDFGYHYSAYDAEGNWTERTVLGGDLLLRVEVRKFEYY